MRKVLNIVLVVLCINWVIIGVYGIGQLDETFLENMFEPFKQKTQDGEEGNQDADKYSTSLDAGGSKNDEKSELVSGSDVDDATKKEQTESILDEMDEVCDMIDVDCQFKVMTLQERYGEKLSETVKLDSKVITYDELRYVQVPHIGYDGMVHLGEIIVNVAVVDDVVGIFKDLFLAKYPIEKMHTIDYYQGSDDDSMADNNSSGFNFREMASGGKLSLHSYGLAIDLNPIMNPYIKDEVVLPASGVSYV
ncbi:MAG TPA: hypothetical protein DCY20_08725, partial [Firmicutes bacterium]|nr:hypothetical protein [Bacillota bacterium]